MSVRAAAAWKPAPWFTPPLCHRCPPTLPCVQESIVVVEYPKKLASLVRQRLGPLEKLRDRRYGRTYMAIYGPAEQEDEE